MTKYKNIKVHVAEGDFDSKSEYARWLFLKDKKRQGDITILERQVKYDLVVNCVKICRVVPDFRYTLRNGVTVVDDYKGVLLPISKLKYKLLEALYNIPVNISKTPTQWDY